MKRQSLLRLLLSVVMLCAVAVGFIACSVSAGKKEETLSVWLDRYDEKTIELESGKFSEFEWTTSNDKVVEIKGDKLSATGEGTAEVKGTNDRYLVTLNVTVTDSGARPRVALDDVETYESVETTITPAVSYNGEIIEVDADFTATVEDPSVATCDGLKVTALEVGQTQLSVKGEYKGIQLEKTVVLTVKPYSFIELEGENDEFTIYNAKDSGLSYLEIPVNVVVKGEKVENPEVEYLAEKAGIVEFDGNTVKAVSVGTTEVTAKSGDNTVNFTVTVLPNYVEEIFNNTGSAYGTVYEAYNGDEAIGGRKEGLFKYVTGDVSIEGQGYWSQRITNGKAALSCIDVYKEYGYRYFAYDLFVTADARFLAPVGGSNDTFYAPLDEYFDVDGLKVISDGKITNKFVTGKWMTIVYDLRERIMIDAAANNDFYLALNASYLTSYLTNIRYYLDDTFMPEDGALSYVEKGGYVQANNDEFASYHTADESRYQKESGEVGGVKTAYRLTGISDEYKKNTLVIASSTGRTRADSIINLKEKGNYLTFDLYVENAEELYFAINYGKTETNVVIGKTDFEKLDWLSLVSDGKLLHVLKAGQWVTVSVEYGKLLEELNVESNSPVAIEFGVTKTDDVVYIDNIRYYETEAYLPTEYGDKAPAFIELSDTSLLVVANEKINLTAFVRNLDGEVKAALVSSNPSVVEIGADGAVYAKASGFAVVTASYDGVESVECAIRVISENTYAFTAKEFYEQPALTYAARYTPDSPEYDTAESLKITFRVKDDFKYLHILTGIWGQQSNGVRIGKDSYSGFNAWNWTSPGFDASELTVLDKNGKALGRLGGEGVNWEVGETYTIVLALAKTEGVYFFVSDSLLDTEEYWWENGGSYYKSDLLDYIEFKSFEGIYAEKPVPFVVIDKTDGMLFSGEEIQLNAFVAFERDASLTWTTDSSSVATVTNGLVRAVGAGKTRIIVSSDGAEDAVFTVSVVQKNAIMPEWSAFHEDFRQGALLVLDKYAGYDGLSFTITFADDNSYLTVTDGVECGWAVSPDCATIIGPGTYKKVWGAAEYPNISTDVFKIKDAEGNYIDYTSGYTFIKGVKYTVEYSIDDSRHLSFWVASTDVHGIFWTATNYYSDALEHITFGDFYGLWSEAPEVSVSLDKSAQSVTVGQKVTLVPTVKNADGLSLAWTSDNAEVATVDNGVVTAVGEGVAVITLTVGEKTATFTLTVGKEAKTLLNSSMNIFHEEYKQGMYVSFEDYVGYDKVVFTVTFNESGKFFTITDSASAGWGVNPEYATVIGPGVYKSTWGSAASQTMPVDWLKISDGNGYIDYTSGYTFERGVTYTVEYTLAEGRSLAFWVADTDVHGLFWKAGEYRILAEAVTFGKFYGVKTN